MKQSINFYDFERAFSDYGREKQFSWDGLRALFDWFEQYDDDCGTETELDVIAICCEFTEYEDFTDFRDDYGTDTLPDLETVEDRTTVIRIPDTYGFIIQQF